MMEPVRRRSENLGLLELTKTKNIDAGDREVVRNEKSDLLVMAHGRKEILARVAATQTRLTRNPPKREIASEPGESKSRPHRTPSARNRIFTF
jgi:hypothetical protein